MLDNQELLQSQYDVVAGKWPESKDELVFVVSEKNYIMDTALFTLGLKDQALLKNFMESKEIEDDGRTFTFDELLNQTYKVVLNTDFYSYNEELGYWEDFSDSETYLEKILEGFLKEEK